MLSWLIPSIISLIGTAVGAGTSISNNNKQLRFQEQQLAKEQQLTDKINNDKLLLNNSYKEIDNQLVNINFINYHFRGIIKTIKACKQNFHFLFNSLPISCFI